MAWPYAMYTDPALAATLLAAATATLPPPPYHGPPGIPAAHLAPSYPAAAAAAYYAARYTPYPSPVTGTGSSALHRPHPRTAAAYPAHPHILQPHPSLQPLHLSGLGVPTVGNTAFQMNSPPSNASTTNTTYRPSLHSEMSPVHSDASSDCDCVGSQPHHHNGQQHMEHGKSAPPSPSMAHVVINQQVPSKVQPTGIGVNGLPGSIQTIGVFEGKNTYSAIMASPTKMEPPKLFQPYKNDISERA